MKTALTLFIVACQSVVALAQDGNKQPYLTKSLSNDAINSVVVSTSAGGIYVNGESGQSPRIEVYIRGNNNRELSKEEIEKKLAEDYDMNIAVNGHELTATVKQKKKLNFNWNSSMSISFKIYVPQQVNTNLHTSGGGIDLNDLKGTETFSTSGGGLRLNKLVGTIHGRTSGGGIDVSNSAEDIDLSTSGGGIRAENCKGKIRLITSGGGLELSGLSGTITAHTSGGGVRGRDIEGELITGTSGGGIDLKNLSCSLEAHTSGGSLNAEMKQVGQYVKLAASGSINIELPAKKGYNLAVRGDSVHPSKIEGFTGEWSEHRIDGSINGGGIPVEAHASGGDVNIHFN